jgi:hypothetical protein
MLSYAVNTTFREDEVYWSTEYSGASAPASAHVAPRPHPDPHVNILRPRPPYERHDCEDTKTESK